MASLREDLCRRTEGTQPADVGCRTNCSFFLTPYHHHAVEDADAPCRCGDGTVLQQGVVHEQAMSLGEG